MFIFFMLRPDPDPTGGEGTCSTSQAPRYIFACLATLDRLSGQSPPSKLNHCISPCKQQLSQNKFLKNQNQFSNLL